MSEQEEKKPRKRKLSGHQQKLLKVLPTTDSLAKAGRQAGYTTRQATYTGLMSIRRKAPELLAGIGYGQEEALRDLVEMTQATKVEIGWDKGVIIQEKEYADNATRLRARIELNKMHGHYPQDNRESTPPVNVNVQSNALDFSQATEEELDQILRFCGRFRRGLQQGPTGEGTG